MKQTSILIVEDESIIAFDLQNQLNSLGYEVIGSVTSGQAAIEAAEEKQPDLVLMDIMLTGAMDGVEAADEIHRIVKCPVVFLTAYSDDDTLGRAQMTSPFGYLVKPFKREDLHAAILTALSRHRSEKELVESCDVQRELALRCEAHARSTNKSLAIEVAGRSQAEENLSRNHMLLDCISRAQSQFIADVAPAIIYDGLLSDLLLLTNSEYGFIAEVLHDASGAPYAKTYSITDIAWNDEIRATYAKHASDGLEFRNLNTLFGAVMMTGRAVISNDPPNDPRSGGIPEGHPPLKAFLGLPIHHGDDLVGIAGIANRPDGYDEVLVTYLEPFLSTCGNLTAAYRSDQQRCQAEETNALLSRAIEQAGETIVITDAEATIQYVNPAFERTTGYTAKEAIGQNPRVLKSGQHDNAFYKSMWETLSSGNQWSGEITNRKKDGTLFTEHAIISPVFDSQGKIVNYVAARNDITETKRLQELESRALRLEAAGQIAGQVAHDFNNLLGPLVAYPDLIRDELPAEHPALEYLEVMQNSAIQIAEINQQLLTLGRRGHYLQKPIDLNRVLSKTIKQISDLPQDVEIHPDTAPDLKPVMGGSSQLGRVILNLIVNAIDAMPDGGQVTLRTENATINHLSGLPGPIPTGEYVVLTVADTGCGIPSEALPNIFDPFFTSKKTDSKRGSGLGLSVVAAVVEDHGGYIDVNSTPGGGTSFALYFPFTQQIPDEPKSYEIQHGTETILIVDDDKSQRIVCARLLDKLGYKTNVKESGEAAVDFLKTNPHDLLLLDMKLGPGIDGTETFRRSLQINPEQRAIIISGLADTDRVQTALEMGVGAFLKKPITLEALARTVRAELDRPPASREAACIVPV